MNYQEKVSTRAEVRALYEKVIADPGIARYRGYTATRSYGWDESVGDYIKREGEAWFENPAYDPAHVTEGRVSDSVEQGELLDERLEEAERRAEQLSAENRALLAEAETLRAETAALESKLAEVSDARDGAAAALAAMRATLQSIRDLTEVA